MAKPIPYEHVKLVNGVYRLQYSFFLVLHRLIDTFELNLDGLREAIKQNSCGHGAKHLNDPLIIKSQRISLELKTELASSLRRLLNNNLSDFRDAYDAMHLLVFEVYIEQKNLFSSNENVDLNTCKQKLYKQLQKLSIEEITLFCQFILEMRERIPRKLLIFYSDMLNQIVKAKLEHALIYDNSKTTRADIEDACDLLENINFNLSPIMIPASPQPCKQILPAYNAAQNKAKSKFLLLNCGIIVCATLGLIAASMSNKPDF